MWIFVENLSVALLLTYRHEMFEAGDLGWKVPEA